MIVLPFVGFGLVYGLLRLWLRDRKKSLLWAINVTNIFLIEAVVVFYSEIWPRAVSAWWWIVLLFLSVASVLGWLQYRLRGKLSLRKIGITTWRILFLILCCAYIVLFTTGIWKQLQVA
jgi:hypothetical protein